MIGQTEMLSVAADLNLFQEDKQTYDASEPRLALSVTVHSFHRGTIAIQQQLNRSLRKSSHLLQQIIGQTEEEDV